MGKVARLSLRRFGGSAAATPLLLAATAGLAQGGPALPSGGAVAAGQASIIAVDPANTVIRQQSSKAIINWQDFSIGAGASITFQQPDNRAITLNRVTGPDMSAIQGNISANGQVWLVNRNGILFGQGSRIDVGGLIATTSDIRDADFLSGHYDFNAPSSNANAAVVNQGSIKAATGGTVILSGNSVANPGVIQARLGHVVLGGAGTFAVSFDGDKLLQYQINAPVSETPRDESGKPAAALVSNTGTINAEGGSVLMTARAARDVVNNVINTSGIIQARSVSMQNGEVVLDAGDGVAAVAGTVDVSGQAAGESGGSIAVQGGKVAVADGARLDASGDVDGGRVLVGGDLHGSGALPVAGTATVGRAAIAASGGSGHGGTVAIISSGTTNVAATISARGRVTGGTVETSGHDLKVAAETRVDTTASAGATGQWFLDPQDVDIDPTYAANIVASLGSTNVAVTATHDLSVNAQMVYDSPNSLSLLAGHDLVVNASVQNSGSGGILAVAGWDGITAASAIFTTPGAYGLGGGSVRIGSSVAVALGSRNGTTAVAAQNLFISAQREFAQLGYHGTGEGSVNATGAINVLLTGGLALTGGGIPNLASAAFAQIGHGGRGIAGNISGDITITAGGSVSLTAGAAPQDFAAIGNGDLSSTAGMQNGVRISSGGNIMLGEGTTISASGSGDALVLASAGNFINQAGSAALGVVGGGRWLLFLDDPENNKAGSLTASPFYDRAYDFSANAYAPVAGAGNRFVYGVAPVVTVTAADQTRVYGTANPALSATVTGGLLDDAPSGVFSGSAAISTTALSNSAVGDYAITASLGTLVSDFNYRFQFVNGTLHVSPALVSASLTGTVRKVYDGTAVAGLSSANYQITGLLFGDNVTVDGPVAGTYDSKTVGNGKTVSVTGLSLAGPARANYVLASSGVTAAIGEIDPASLTATLTGSVRKVYDGTSAATLSAGNYQMTGVVPGDGVTLSAPVVGTYDSKNAGNGKTVSVTGLALAGPDAANYVLASSGVTAAIGEIDPASLTVALTGSVRKVYDGTAAAALSGDNYQLTGVVPGDGVTLPAPVPGFYDSKNAGDGKLVSVTGLALAGPDAANYVLASSGAAADIGTIDPASLTVVLTGSVRKIYDGAPAAALSGSNYQLTGAVPGDGVTLSAPTAGTYDSKNAGNGKIVSVTGLALAGPDAANYVLASSGAAAAIGEIDPARLTVILTGVVQKSYDGTDIAFVDPSNFDLTGVRQGDTVALNTPATGSYDTQRMGAGKIVTVSGLTLTGPDGGNYVLSSSAVSGAVGTIALQRVTDALGNSYTINGVLSALPTPPGPAPAPRAPSAETTPGAGSLGDATQTDAIALQIGGSLNASSAQSSSSVLIDGLLRQFTPQAGNGLPHGVPPYGQVYSSWGNEAFWQ